MIKDSLLKPLEEKWHINVNIKNKYATDPCKIIYQLCTANLSPPPPKYLSYTHLQALLCTTTFTNSWRLEEGGRNEVISGCAPAQRTSSCPALHKLVFSYSNRQRHPSVPLFCVYVCVCWAVGGGDKVVVNHIPSRHPSTVDHSHPCLCCCWQHPFHRLSVKKQLQKRMMTSRLTGAAVSRATAGVAANTHARERDAPTPSPCSNSWRKRGAYMGSGEGGSRPVPTPASLQPSH